MPAEPTKSTGRLKTFLGTLAGLFSGAAVMYLTPIVDRVVKPGKPVANFAVEHDSLTVSVHNRSIGNGSAWLDFGDGSPLEPVTADTPISHHTYANPGDYTIKLTMRNLIGEENERTVMVRLDSPRTDPPKILALEATPLSPGAFAPATFKVSSKSKNTQLCVWDFSDDRPLEISAESPNSQERLVTFWKPGGYVIKLAAVNGAQATEKTEIVYVNEPPAGTVTATIHVGYQAVKVEPLVTPYTFHDVLPAGSKEKSRSVALQVPARKGYEIKDVRLKSITGPSMEGRSELPIDARYVDGQGGKSLKLKLNEDRHGVALTGELVRTGKDLPSLTVPVLLIQERRTKIDRPPVPLTTTLTLPGSVQLNMPPAAEDWQDTRPIIQGFDLQDGDRMVWKGPQLPTNAPVVLGNRRFLLTAKPLGQAIRVDLVETKTPVTMLDSRLFQALAIMQR